jgi:hypothetical protein
MAAAIDGRRHGCCHLDLLATGFVARQPGRNGSVGSKDGGWIEIRHVVKASKREETRQGR